MLTHVNTGEKIQLAGQCLLEIKTRAEEQTEPLSSVTAKKDQIKQQNQSGKVNQNDNTTLNTSSIYSSILESSFVPSHKFSVM